MDTILSYGLGCESSAILAKWLLVPSSRPCPLEELIIITAQTGNEYKDTQRDVETHILPLLRKHRVRYVQVARSGHLESDGITILDDTCEPESLWIEGSYKLSDELRTAGTVPQYGGVSHACSLKFKAWVIETWISLNLTQPVRHAFGYNADEERRVEKSEAATLKRVAFGFNADEQNRIIRASTYDSPSRQSFYPLLEWGWSRQDCIDYLQQCFGVIWRKSACVACPFNALKEDGVQRHHEHPEQVAEAMMLEHLSLSLNPRGTLYRNQSLIQITRQSGNIAAMESFQRALGESEWAVYRVRRIYQAAKDAAGKPNPDKKGVAYRAVEQITEKSSQATAQARLMSLCVGTHEVVEGRGITYLYARRCGATYPAREEFLVALPAFVATKARYGLEWFEEKWEASQGCLFPLDQAA